MEIPLRLWAVYCRALIVLIIRKFLFPSRQNLPCCSLSPLFLVLSAADVKNRLFVPSADALSVFEDFHYVLPWPPCAQTQGSRYRQPVLWDGLSSDSGVRQSSRAGMRFFMVLVPVWVSRGGPERLGEVVPSCSTSGERSLQSCSLWGWAVPQDVPHPSLPRLLAQRPVQVSVRSASGSRRGLFSACFIQDFSVPSSSPHFTAPFSFWPSF